MNYLSPPEGQILNRDSPRTTLQNVSPQVRRYPLSMMVHPETEVCTTLEDILLLEL